MEPNLYTGQRVLVSKSAYWFGDPHRGDVIVFRKPGEPKRVLIKRIIGMPGDKLEIRDGKVYVNNEPLEEPYIKEPISTDYNGIEIPVGHYFIVGDNRNHSDDSRDWGTLPREILARRGCATGH